MDDDGQPLTRAKRRRPRFTDAYVKIFDVVWLYAIFDFMVNVVAGLFSRHKIFLESILISMSLKRWVKTMRKRRLKMT